MLSHLRFRPIICLVALGLIGVTCPVALAADEEGRKAVDADGRIVSFERDIAPILRERCLECHNEKEAKADFRVDDPEVMSWYVEAGDVEASTLFVDFLLSHDPDMLMPPPSKGGPLTPQELTLLRVWIEEGADWPEDVAIVPVSELDGEGAEADADSSAVAAAPTSLVDRLWAFQGFFHPATVHFPIALFLFGAVFVVLGWKWPAVGRQIPLACLLAGAVTAIASTAMGWSFAMEEGYGSWAKVDFDSEVFWHRWSGVIVTTLSVVLAIVALVALKRDSSKLHATWKGGLLVVAALVGLVGHQGGELSYGKDFYPRAFRILWGTEGESGSPATAESEVEAEGGDPEGGDPEGAETVAANL